jgi:hypothetical protein
VRLDDVAKLCSAVHWFNSFVCANELVPAGVQREKAERVCAVDKFTAGHEHVSQLAERMITNAVAAGIIAVAIIAGGGLVKDFPESLATLDVIHRYVLSLIHFRAVCDESGIISMCG